MLAAECVITYRTKVGIGMGMGMCAGSVLAAARLFIYLFILHLLLSFLLYFCQLRDYYCCVFFYIFILFFLLTFDFVIAPLYARMAVWLQIYYPFCFDRTGVLRAANKKLIIKDFDMCAKKKRG